MCYHLKLKDWSKNMKKLIIAFVLLFTLAIPNLTEARGFSGIHRSVTHNFFSTHSSSTESSRTYHSGYKSTLNKASKSLFRRTPFSKRNSFWSHAAAFGAGSFIGSMFHPFGYHYFGHSYGFSLFGFLIDILIILIILRVIKGIFTRRRY